MQQERFPCCLHYWFAHDFEKVTLGWTPDVLSPSPQEQGSRCPWPDLMSRVGSFSDQGGKPQLLDFQTPLEARPSAGPHSTRKRLCIPELLLACGLQGQGLLLMLSPVAAVADEPFELWHDGKNCLQGEAK